MAVERTSESSLSEEVRDRVLIVSKDGSRSGFANRLEWQPERLSASETLPEVQFADEDEGRTVSLSSLKRISFVHSFDPPQRERIQFYDGVLQNDTLWVRLRLRDEDWMEGFIANTAQIFTSRLIAMSLSDPESNETLVLFPPAEIEEFQVLGLRAFKPSGDSATTQRPSTGHQQANHPAKDC